MKRWWIIAAAAVAAIAAVAAAQNIETSPFEPPPIATDDDAGTAEAAPAEPEDAATEAETAVATEPLADPADAGSRRDVRSSAVQRRRDSAVVGGWVRSVPGDAGVEVDELILGSNGEWLRRLSVVSLETGLTAAPEQTNGTWFTEGPDLVLLEQGSLVDERLREPYTLNEPADEMTLGAGDGEPAVYHRYR